MLVDLVLRRAATDHPDLEACVVLLDAESPRPDAPPLSGPWEGPVAVDGLAADVTPAAVADLAVEPGADLWFVVKAAEVAVHAAGS